MSPTNNQLGPCALKFKAEIEAAKAKSNPITDRAKKQELSDQSESTNDKVSALRQATRQAFDRWMAEASKVAGVICTEEEIGVGDYKVKLRFYRPSIFEGDVYPTLVFHPGGGLVLDSQVHHDYPCSIIAKTAGMQVVSIQPPLAPEHKYTTILEVAYKATKHLFEKASEYKIGRQDFFLGGYSMGGCLAAMITNQSLLTNELSIAGQILISSRLDCSGEQQGNDQFNQGGENDFMSNPETRELFASYCFEASDNLKSPEISPYYADVDGLPPTILLGGSCDALMADIRAMAAKMNIAPIELPGLIHASFLLHHLMPDGEHPAIIMGRQLKVLMAKLACNNKRVSQNSTACRK